MYLSHVSIKNFRNLEDFSLDLKPGLTVLVGENNIGKTNIIHAIRLALGPASTTSRQWPRPSDVRRGSVTSTFSVDLRFTDPSDQEIADFMECLVFNRENPASSTVEIHYQWSWNERTQKYTERRWGGLEENDTTIPLELLQALPFVYLEPLRDALSTLTAGRSSRIAGLLRKMRQQYPDAEERIERIIAGANAQLDEDDLIRQVLSTIQKNLVAITSADLSQTVDVVTSAQKFDSIVGNLSLMLKLPDGQTAEGIPAFTSAEISENGLGYNNILYIATILADLANCSDGDIPILCVEEPEAHLHPQLQLLLGEYFRQQAERTERCLQVLLTTHSPNLVAHLPLRSLSVLHRPNDDRTRPVAVPIWDCGLEPAEYRKLERLIDTTKASLFFARAVILVEGVCEQLLLPPIASQLGYELAGKSISVIAVHGVNFATLAKLFGPTALRLRCAIVTDGDPKTEIREQPLLPDLNQAGHWRIFPLLNPVTPTHAEDTTVQYFRSQVTLEYDLAYESGNAELMAGVWRTAFPSSVAGFTAEHVTALETDEQKATFVWQAVCQASTGKSNKAAFSHELADRLQSRSLTMLAVPEYLRQAIEYVAGQTVVGAGEPNRA